MSPTLTLALTSTVTSTGNSSHFRFLMCHTGRTKRKEVVQLNDITNGTLEVAGR